MPHLSPGPQPPLPMHLESLTWMTKLALALLVFLAPLRWSLSSPTSECGTEQEADLFCVCACGMYVDAHACGSQTSVISVKYQSLCISECVCMCVVWYVCLYTCVLWYACIYVYVPVCLCACIHVSMSQDSVLYHQVCSTVPSFDFDF